MKETIVIIDTSIITDLQFIIHVLKGESEFMTGENKVSFTGDPKYKKVILLGMDGLDPKILSQLMEKGELPSFTRLSQKGGFSEMATSNPAQSPVAWASIATGNNPGYHGIFDFLGRRVSDYMPELAILRINPKNVLVRENRCSCL